MNYDWFQPRYPSPRPTKPKIVSVPVHFLRSDSTRSESALKIQKLFRGFAARRIVKQLMELKREVEEIEVEMSNSVEILRRIDAKKERLILNERLMSVLLKLDSVNGTLPPGVRDCRKAVIKKAIALQERIDDAIKEIEIEPEVCNQENSSESPVSSSVSGVVEHKTDSGEEEEMKKDHRNMVVAKLVENNEAQMKMIRLLTKRVDQLERALLCKKLKNKQRKLMNQQCCVMSEQRKY